MKKKFLSIFLALAACLALLSVTAAAEETEIRYLWQTDDGIYWSTTTPSDLTASDGGTALEKSTLTLSTSISYPVYKLPQGSYLMLGDITLNGTLLAYDDITLDLNGHVLALSESAENGSIINMQSGSLTLKSCDTESQHKFDTSNKLWKLAASDAMGDNIKIVTGGVLTGGKGMRTSSDTDIVPMGGAVCVLNGSFTMENCNIVGCTATGAGAVYVKKSTVGNSFTMTGSKIMGCTASGDSSQSCGGAVYSGAAFVMSDSVIEACTSDAFGGGICISGAVTLKSGSVIRNCKGAKGGGVHTDTALQMEAGAVIENCTATESGGGVYLLDGNETNNTMAGKISGCRAERGGGVYYNFQNGRALTISGTIENCIATSGGGGGVYLPSMSTLAEKTVILKGGTITGCETSGNGGGVYVDGNTASSSPNTFKLESGTIKSCTAVNGGGVYLGCTSSARTAPVFTMEGGSITGCSASGSGGGVYAGNGDSSQESLNSTVTLSGGSITGNNAESNGGGIYVETSNLTVRGSVTVTDNVSGGTHNTATGLYENGTANNIFLPDSYTLSFLYVTGGKVGFSFESLSEGMTVAKGGNADSLKYCVFDAGDEWALYEEDGAFKVGKRTVLLKHGDASTGYVKFTDAHSAAEIGDTLQLLADMTEELSISKTVTLDLNGNNVSDLTVSEPVTVTDSVGGGVISSLMIDVTNVTVGSLLDEGYGFEDSGGTWYDSTFTDTKVYNVAVKKLPITSVTLAANRTAAVGQTYPTYPYNESYDNGSVITTIVQPADGNDLTYHYYVDDQIVSHFGVTGEETTTYDCYLYNLSGLSVGTHTIYVKAEKDGYTLQSNIVTVEIAKAALKDTDYTAPTALTGLTFDNSGQQLITAGSIKDGITGPQFEYSKTNELGGMEWYSTIPTATNAGTYTVYWYIDGGTNYNNVGSRAKPAGEIKVTIAPKSVTNLTVSIDSDFNCQYTGQQITPNISVTADGNTLTAGNYTVSYGENIHAGENAGSVTVTAVTNGNYSFSPVTETFTIEKAAAPTGVTATPTEIIYTQTPYTVDLSTVITGMPTDAGNVSYSDPNNGVLFNINGNILTLSDTITYKIGQSVTVYVLVSSDNYKDARVEVTIRLLDKTPKNLAVTMTGWTYGDTASTPSYTKPEGAGEATVQYKAQGAEDDTYTTDVPTNAGEYTVKVSCETTTERYTGTAAFTIEKKDITDAVIGLNGVSSAYLTYDGNEKSRTVTSVMLGSETLTANTDYTVSGDLTGKNADTYTVTVSGQGNYTGTATTTWTLGKKTIYASTPVAEKEYDGTTTATVTVNFDTPAAQAALVAGDSIEVTGLIGTFDNDNAGTGKTVTIDSRNAVVSGKNSGNYEIIYPSEMSTGVITAKPVTATVASPEKVYDGGTGVALTATVTSGLIAGDSIAITGLTGTFDTADVGTGKTVTVNADGKTITGSGFRNYNVTIPPTATGTITRATPTGAPKYTAITTSGKKLSDANLTTEGGTFSIDGTVKWVDDDDNELPGTTSVEANKEYKWLFTPTDSTNYNTLSGTVTLWHKSSSSGGGSSAPVTSPTITVPVSSDHASVEVKAEVSKGNATVEVSDKQIENVIADHAGEVTLDVSGLKNVESATVPSHVVEKTNEAENTGLTVSLPAGSVTLDETALGSVTENANGKDVTVSVVSVSTANLSPVVKEVIGMEPTVVAVVDVNVTIGGKKQSSFDGGKVTISVPYTPKAGEDTGKLTVWFIKDNGTIENKGGYYDAKNKCFVFETDHLSQYILVNTNEMQTFVDVPTDAYFANAVSWAAGKGITGGVDATHFMPYSACTRAQLVTFLWRAAGSPEPKAASSFSDVSADAYYAKAVAWAVENGITGGIGNNRFAPDLTCTRAQAAAFLFRYAAANGMETVTLQELVGGYGDAAQVPSYALPAFNWALAQGILQGYNGNLMPNNDCTRAQIVTMLYRLLGTN